MKYTVYGEETQFTLEIQDISSDSEIKKALTEKIRAGEIPFPVVYSDDSPKELNLDFEIHRNGKNYDLIRIGHLFEDDDPPRFEAYYEILPNEMHNVTVLRIQNGAGIGPYRAKDAEAEKILFPQGVLDSLVRGPSPDIDNFPPYVLKILNSQSSEAVFGFLNKSQLEMWFNDFELAEFKKLGFEVVEVKAKVAWATASQVVFIPEL